jgi:uncharacterized protein
MNTSKVGPVQPWWRIRIVWLAFGGPALVVLASFVSLFLAVHGRDIPLSEMGAAETVAEGTATPAEQARNHVATPPRR